MAGGGGGDPSGPPPAFHDFMKLYTSSGEWEREGGESLTPCNNNTNS